MDRDPECWHKASRPWRGVLFSTVEQSSGDKDERSRSCTHSCSIARGSAGRGAKKGREKGPQRTKQITRTIVHTTHNRTKRQLPAFNLASPIGLHPHRMEPHHHLVHDPSAPTTNGTPCAAHRWATPYSGSVQAPFTCRSTVFAGSRSRVLLKQHRLSFLGSRGLVGAFPLIEGLDTMKAPNAVG